MSEKRRGPGPGGWRALSSRVAVLAVLAVFGGRASGGELLDLARAEICPAASETVQQNAAAMLRDEIAKRTRIHLPSCADGPAGDRATIRIGTAGTLPAALVAMPSGLSLPPDAEGYAVWVDGEAGPTPTVYLVGRDARGALFATGRLLRALEMGRDRLRLDPGFRISTAPRFPLRGHQLGYRPKTNSYDGWSPEMWEQYVRDLVVFGANAIEVIPPRSDDDDDSPHYPRPPLATMVGMSRLAEQYDLALWIWYPVIDDDDLDAATVERALQEREEVFRALPKIDVVFVPGGDPGEVHPAQLLPLMEKQKALLNRFHPEAQIWVSPQGFDWDDDETVGWLEEFYTILQRDEPAWLDGVVFGPQVRDPVPELRRRLPSRYPIRRYPDITHCIDAQYAVPEWDPAFQLTLNREPINPRPRGYADIFRAVADHTIGFITYSEGVNDDVNKVVWSGLGWDPETPVEEILTEYGRYFISGRFAERFAEGLLGLERNWQGPLLANVGVYETLRIFQAMEEEATPQERLNWRFQLALYRAYYDAYTRRRLIHETELEEQAMDVLRTAERIGALPALERAEAVLDRAQGLHAAPDWRARTFELAEALFQSIRMQMSVPKYAARSIRRGANLDLIDVPLNDFVELGRRFEAIRALDSEAERLREIGTITAERYRRKLEHDEEVYQEGIQ